MLRHTLLAIAVICLTSCFRHNAPSPQDTTPSKEAMCADLRGKMMSGASTGPSAVGVSDAQMQDYQEAYKNGCQ